MHFHFHFHFHFPSLQTQVSISFTIIYLYNYNPFFYLPYNSNSNPSLSSSFSLSLSSKNRTYSSYLLPLLSFEHSKKKMDLNLEATELRLGLPGTDESEQETLCNLRNNKRSSPDMTDESSSSKASIDNGDQSQECPPPAKAQIVGWPPIRSYRKNSFQQQQQAKKGSEAEGAGIYVKVSMDGAPYLRKIDLKVYKGYSDVLKALENMFKFNIGQYSEREGYKGSEYVPTYEDKDGDWMLVGDVPWDMFMSSCKRLRIMKGSEARGLGCCGAV